MNSVGASLYALRHIQASMPIDVGIDIVGISRRLGHKVVYHRPYPSSSTPGVIELDEQGRQPLSCSR
jgi:hypothetical protein